ncbi:MAG: hypothetical protein JWQ34_1088 [Mucilaginibacter sp.]|nr:hypothetical protein [Mucilaginibacter sp.]
MSSVAQSNTVDSLSFQNLSLELLNNYANIGSATGFIIEKNNVDYLITNLHVVTGLDYFSHAIIDPQQQIPNNIAIWHNAQTLGHWSKSIETLYDRNKNKRWIECEVAGKTVDIIALPLQNLPKGAKLYPVHLKGFNDSITVMPGFSASIIGSPYGQSSDGKLAIWKTGHIASDLDIDANGLPLFLIDATTRPGMSGSMVVLRMIPFLTRQGISMGLGTRFLGVYTAQGNQDELGYVIKPIALKALIDKLP